MRPFSGNELDLYRKEDLLEGHHDQHVPVFSPSHLAVGSRSDISAASNPKRGPIISTLIVSSLPAALTTTCEA